MINVSNEYKEVLSGNDRRFYAYAEITLKDNTVLNLDNSNILDMKIDDDATPQGQFTIGSAIINQLTLQINNLYDEFSDYDFTDAIIRPSIGLQLSETIESLHKGVFIAEDPKAVGSIIHITAFDNMIKFDRPFSEVSQVFPCTIRDLLITVSSHCGIPLATSTFYNQDYVINERPDDEAISCREIVSWIAQIAVSFAKINNQGSLVLKWYDNIEETNYDGGRFDNDTPYSSGDNIDGGTFAFNDGDNIDGGNFTDLKKFHHIYSLYNKLDVAIDDVVITGVSVSDPITTENKVVYGETGYVISIEGNKLIQSELDAQFVAQSVGQKIIGMRFRPFETTTRSDPTIETGDALKVSDRKGNVYHSFVTNYTYSIAKPCRISCEAESPLRSSSTRYSESTKAIVEARKEIDKKITSYDLAQQMFNNLVFHSYGLYYSEEKLLDGSIIKYGHDKPTVAESQNIWKQTAEVFAVSNDGGETWRGMDKDGNILATVLTAIGVRADWIRTGKLMSEDGSVLIDMVYGVANEDNVSDSDNIQDGFPLVLKFQIGETVSKINNVLLEYVQKNFRTYSKTTSSGGARVITSGLGSTFITTSYANPATSTGSALGTTNETSHASGADSHAHTYHIPQHSHSLNLSHNHTVSETPHSHTVDISSHTHNLDFGIQEQAITNYAIDIYVDGTLRVQIPNSSSNEQGIVDLTQWITTVGWHTIEIRSTTLKRVSARLAIKSYLKM